MLWLFAWIVCVLAKPDLNALLETQSAMVRELKSLGEGITSYQLSSSNSKIQPIPALDELKRTTESLHTTIALLYEVLPSKSGPSLPKKDVENRLEVLSKEWLANNEQSLEKYRQKTYAKLDTSLTDYISINEKLVAQLNDLKTATSDLEALVEDDGRFTGTYILLFGALVALVMVFFALGRIPLPKSFI